MKNFENLGKELGKQEQKKIIGGSETRLWCWDGTSFIRKGTYTNFGDCLTDFWNYCVNPPYEYCYCTSGAEYYQSGCDS